MPSPGLESPDGPSHNAKGLLIIGPQAVSFSDVLAKLIDEAKGQKDESHYAPSPDAERKAFVTYESRRPPESRTTGKRLFSFREAQRQRESAA